MKSITKNLFAKLFFLIVGILTAYVYFLGLRGSLNFPVGLKLGFIEIRYYAISILLGITVVSWLFNKEKYKYKELKNIDTIDALVIIFVFGILGARLWHVMTDFHLYQYNPKEVLYIWNGGLGIFGGLLGGILGAWIYAKNKKTDLIKALALVSVFLPLGQFIGRFGNFFNQELYGPSTDLPWGFFVRDSNNYFHPSFLYEQIGMIFLFFIMVYFYKKFRLVKELLFVYLAGYSGVRFVVDFYRTEPEVLFGLTVAQTFSIMIFIVTGAVLIGSSFVKISRRKSGTPQT